VFYGVSFNEIKLIYRLRLIIYDHEIGKQKKCSAANLLFYVLQIIRFKNITWQCKISYRTQCQSS